MFRLGKKLLFCAVGAVAVCAVAKMLPGAGPVLELGLMGGVSWKGDGG